MPNAPTGDAKVYSEDLPSIVASAYQPGAKRSWLCAMWFGAKGACPRCGKGHLFRRYLKPAASCEACGQSFEGHEADDAPPYITIMLVGHTLVPVMLLAKKLFDPSLAMQLAISLPLVLIASVFFLPVSKGALIGLQWANRMHGFGNRETG